jgi:hypothetical protein
LDLELIHFALLNFNDLAIFNFDTVFSILLAIVSLILDHTCVEDSAVITSKPLTVPILESPLSVGNVTDVPL